MPTWPGTLPQFVLQDGYQEEPVDNTIRTQMEHGVLKSRKRFTAAPRRVVATVRLTAAQKVYLDDFYELTCAGGSLDFDWVRPYEQTAAVFKFLKPPNYTSVGPTTLNAQLELRTVI